MVDKENGPYGRGSDIHWPHKKSKSRAEIYGEGISPEDWEALSSVSVRDGGVKQSNKRSEIVVLHKITNPWHN